MRLQLLLKAERLPAPKAQYSWKPKKSPNSFCVISNVSEVGSVLGIRRHLLGTTEVVPQCSSPEWATVIILNHTRGTEHRIAIDVFHSMNEEYSHKIEHSERRGHLNVDNAQQLCGILVDIETILSQRDYCLTEKLAHGCKLSVRLEESSSQQSGEFKFHLRGLDCQSTRINFLDRPEFIFEIRRKQKGKTQDTWALVYRSNVAKASLNPYWNEDVVSLETLCNGDVDREIQISVLDTPSRVLLGYTTTSITGLVGAVSERGNAEKALDICKPSHNLLLSSTTNGRLVVLHASVSNRESSSHSRPSETTPRQESLSNLPQAVAVEILSPCVTFDDYMASGRCNLELCVAVDFSRANGDCRLEGTPHYRSEERLNDYEWCMGVLAESVKKYTQDPMITLWGFGAQFHGKPCHIFQCGSSSQNNGGRGLLHAYHAAFQTALEFGYETRYDDVIQAAAHHSKKELDIAQQTNRLAFTVLLVLTVASTERDILAAKERIEAVSGAPLSIIFVRIDNGMHSSLLKNTDSFPCTLLEGSDFTKSRDARALAETVLNNVKPELADYFVSRGIYPPS